MTKRQAFRLNEAQKNEQMRILIAAQSFGFPALTRSSVIGMIATGEARLDLKAKRIIVAFDISDSLAGED